MNSGLFRRDGSSSVITRLTSAPTSAATVAVVGVERGGTSMVAGVLGALGIDMGPRGANHEDPNMFEANPAGLQQYVDLRNSAGSRWGFKLPSGLRSPALQAVKFRELVWILVFRNVVTNVESLVARGDPDVEFAFTRVIKNYADMQRVVCDPITSYIMVAYERAASNPEGFVKELVRALDLPVSETMVQDAIDQISGDGGGYVPPASIWHGVNVVHVDAVPSAASRLAALELVEGGVEIAFADDVPGRKQTYHPLWRECLAGAYVTVILDFHDGFSGLTAYDILLPTSNDGVQIENKGTLRRVGFGRRVGATRALPYGIVKV